MGKELFLGAQMQRIRDLIRNVLREDDGVTAIEYGLLAALVGVAIIGGATALGGGLNTLYTNLGAWFNAITVP
ncbi:Flp family type IVb pilin [Paraburkholderia sp. IMGN_8]|uniref:Flp family type IVb pilin n=1 Tax=Paraburkholderia sp. IMGN_8 TaxID=3136564 RepID=UPI0031014AB8